METKEKLTYDEKISTAIPIWSLLNITEEEYTKKYAQPFNLDTKENKTKIELDNTKNKINQ